jgi:hypothetical protein
VPSASARLIPAAGVVLLLALSGCSVAAADGLPRGIAVTAVSVDSGSLSGGDEIVLTGANLDAVSGVDFGAAAASAVTLHGDSLVVVTPASTDFEATTVPISVHWEGDSGAPTGLEFSYRVVTPLDAQMNYLLAHWDSPNALNFGRLDGTDCVNFTSQALLARGWTMTNEWWHSQSSGVNQYGRPWISSTAFMQYLEKHPELAVPGSAADVAVGDIAQFDYDGTGSGRTAKRNHTGTVSKVLDGQVFVVQHNKDADYEPVADMLASHGPQAKVYYWHLVS